VSALGLTRLSLDVHRENLRAQAAYRRAGFAPTGETFTSVIGPEIVMARPLP
jgi:RimJ/RimL family protein N-acetyltransferase